MTECIRSSRRLRGPSTDPSNSWRGGTTSPTRTLKTILTHLEVHLENHECHKNREPNDLGFVKPEWPTSRIAKVCGRTRWRRGKSSNATKSDKDRKHNQQWQFSICPHSQHCHKVSSWCLCEVLDLAQIMLLVRVSNPALDVI